MNKINIDNDTNTVYLDYAAPKPDSEKSEDQLDFEKLTARPVLSLQEQDSQLIAKMAQQPKDTMADYFFRESKRLHDDSTYWNVLGTLWKLGGTVLQQNLWMIMFNSPRRNKHKLMKTRERRSWRKLPKTIKGYRAVNSQDERERAISWSLSRKTAQKFLDADENKTEVVSRTFEKHQVFAYFDRQQEQEILVDHGKAKENLIHRAE